MNHNHVNLGSGKEEGERSGSLTKLLFIEHLLHARTVQAADVEQKGLCENAKEVCKVHAGCGNAFPTKMLKSLR